MLVNFASCRKDLFLEDQSILPTPIEEEVKEEEVIVDEERDESIPHIYINIDHNEEIVNKENYLNATVEIDGFVQYENLPRTGTRIKGRGNDSWTKPKKPYRLNLNSKASILGLPAAKNWVLLANHQDYSAMTNAVGIKIASLLNMPYTNKIIPVNLTINGIYRGQYNLTEHIEIAKDRVDVDNDGVILELDSYFDEEYKFRSAHFNLPVMLKDASVNSADDFLAIQTDFQHLENLIAAEDFPHNNYGDYFDKLQLVNYLIVYQLTANAEINHPKSVFLHQRKGGKYTMGPVWDFDWGFGFEYEYRDYFKFVDLPILSNGTGGVFFNTFLKDPEIIQLYRQQWFLFKENGLTELLDYMDQYAARINKSLIKDFALWKVGPGDPEKVKNEFKAYIGKRADYMDAYLRSLN